MFPLLFDVDLGLADLATLALQIGIGLALLFMALIAFFLVPGRLPKWALGLSLFGLGLALILNIISLEQIQGWFS